MARRVETHDAGAEYERRHGRPWREDAGFGLYMAMEAVISERTVRGIVAVGRRLLGQRPKKAVEPMPDWCLRAAEAYHRKVPTTSDVSVGSLPLNPAALAMAAALGQGMTVEPGSRLAELLLPQPIRNAEARLTQMNRKRRRDEVRFSFFVGTRVTFHLRHDEEPRPAQVALLAAATGVEPFDTTIGPARKIWEDRMRRWKPEMDAYDWRALIPADEWSDGMALALP